MRFGTHTWQAVALVVAAIGILVQALAGVDYPTVPPGLVILAAAAVVVALVSRAWAAVVGVVVALFILGGGVVADPGWAELVDGSGGVVAGAIVELTGLVLAVAAGALVVARRGSTR